MTEKLLEELVEEEVLVDIRTMGLCDKYIGSSWYFGLPNSIQTRRQYGIL